MKSTSTRGWTLGDLISGFMEAIRLTVRVGKWFLVGWLYADFEAWETQRVGGLIKGSENLIPDHPTVGCICSADVLDSLSMVTEQVIRDDVASGQWEPKDMLMVLIGFGLLVLLCVYGYSKGSTGDAGLSVGNPASPPQLDVYDPIVRYTSGIQGPFSLPELERLNEYLAVQA